MCRKSSGWGFCAVGYDCNFIYEKLKLRGNCTGTYNANDSLNSCKKN